MRSILLLLLLLSMALVGGCTTTIHDNGSEMYKFDAEGNPVLLEDGSQALASKIDLRVTRMTAFAQTNVQGINAKLFDGSDYGIDSSIADPDEKAIAPVTSAITDIVTTVATGGVSSATGDVGDSVKGIVKTEPAKPEGP